MIPGAPRSNKRFKRLLRLITRRYKSFKSLVALHLQNKLPNKILLSGKNGIGKSTFGYHFINYIFSLDEKDSYDLKNFSINQQQK